MTTSNQPASYAFDNADREAADRHRYLAAILDDFSFSRLSSASDLTGARCLEVGAGGGSVAAWLAGRVGPSGRVVATDIDTRHIPPHPGYEVVQHDLIAEPVPAGPWDLIHARLVLMHLKPRREILTRLAGALAPGGALVVEEWDGTVGNFVLAAPDQAAADLLLSFQAAVGRILTSRGGDQTWARQMHAAMLEEGLVDVDTVVHARSWHGGSAGALLMTVTLAQLRDQLRASGFSDSDLDRIHQLCLDPRLVWRGLLTFSTIGRRGR